MKRLLIYLPSFNGGGAERMRGQLAPAFIERGYIPTFVVNYINVPITLPPSVDVICFDKHDTKSALPLLAKAVRLLRPDVVLSSQPHSNIAMALAMKLAWHKAVFVPTYHNAFSHEGTSSRVAKTGLSAATRWAVGSAKHIVAVSKGVADDLAHSINISRSRITTIYNPVVAPGTADLAKQAPDHDWFGGSGSPIILAVGRLSPQKDFGTLLRAFALVARTRDVRLMVLGEGPQRDELMRLADTLGIADRFAIPGFKQNPLSYIASAAVLVMSSQYEGFGNVLVEGLACGTPTMSTDCPFGPAEILDNGQIGPLVPVGDEVAMAEAISRLLDSPPPRERLIQRSQEFTVDHAADAYVRLFAS